MNIIINKKLSEFSDRYHAFIIDLWGVIHDGSSLYPGVLETLQELKNRNKEVVFLSNAPRRAAQAIATLADLGVEEALYKAIITSGEVVFEELKGQDAKEYIYIGPCKDKNLLSGLPYQMTGDINSASFLLVTGFFDDSYDMESVTPILNKAVLNNLPLICANPDLVVVKQSGESFPCAGVIAKAYEAMGGKVQYFGKPYATIYQKSLQMISHEIKHIIAIGDSLGTDIKGAFNMGIDSLLITGGILKQELQQNEQASESELLTKVCAKYGVTPTKVMAAFIW